MKHMNKHCIIRSKNDNIRTYIKENSGLVIIYGATFWGGILVDDNIFKVDYFCDKKAPAWQLFHNTAVINISELEKKITDSAKRATVIIASQDRGTVSSIYKDLMQADLNADVFDYFENEIEFCDLQFEFAGKKYDLFQHSYNCGYFQTRMTERSVELALAKEYIDTCEGNIVEIGAVTPYYFYSNKISNIIDPTDNHKRVLKKSLFDCCGGVSIIVGKNLESL